MKWKNNRHFISLYIFQTNPQGIEPNQLYPVLQQDGHYIMASAPPPYSERDPNIPQVYAPASQFQFLCDKTLQMLKK